MQAKEPLDLKQSINLPKTSFSMKANLPVNEPKWLAQWTNENLYGQAPILDLRERLDAQTKQMNALQEELRAPAARP